jgi:N-acetylglucosamine kinase-like BadF-type ATPase
VSREDEAKRSLERLDEQSEKILGAGNSPPSETEDSIERLGRRIARIISAALAAFLIYWLWRALGS